MKLHSIEFVMTAHDREQLVALIGDTPTKYGIPMLNLLNNLEQRVVPISKPDATDGQEPSG